MEPDRIGTVKILYQTDAEKTFRLITTVITGAYTLFMGYEMLKAICPPIAVYEGILRRWLEVSRPRRIKLTQRGIDDTIGEVTKFVRESE